ncbi:TlpA disulfide reductase family protein [Bosea beijingensis]|uniref:TlpA disulfide reductase family protein n=1 Tax=Bosea beijingensis TaxID=3068632 RepID=UPI0027420363|nr:TlpA disulfide reductase family protein [Bosea sp. REN20]
MIGGRRLAIGGVLLAIAVATSIALLTRQGKLMMPPAAAAIAFEASDGRQLSLADFRGRFILLNLWATWCPPCVKEMPSLDRLQAAKGSETFEVVALSLDRQGMDVVGPFFKRTGIANLAIYLDRAARSMPALKITGLPTTILIDPAGREIARWAGAKEWDHEASIAEIEDLIEKARKAAK